MTRMVCPHLVPIDKVCAECKLEWLGHENEKDAEIGRLRDLLNKTSARNRTLARELRRAKWQR